MREAFRLIYTEAIKVQALKEHAAKTGNALWADVLLRQRQGLLEAMVAIAQAATDPMDRVYLRPYATLDEAWSMVFANAGDMKVIVAEDGAVAVVNRRKESN